MSEWNIVSDTATIIGTVATPIAIEVSTDIQFNLPVFAPDLIIDWMELSEGSAVPVSSANFARIRYDEISGNIQASVNTNPYLNLSSGLSGIATINFGLISARTNMATVTVSGQSGLTTSSKIMVQARLSATTEHSADETMVEPLRFYAGNIVANTSFTIYGLLDEGTTYGDIEINWSWTK